MTTIEPTKTETVRTAKKTTALIAEQNDQFRRSFGTNFLVRGKVGLTPAVAGMGTDFAGKLFDAVRSFNSFTEDNDPYGERDFGAVEIDGTKVFWKIDLYDTAYDGGSEAPADLDRTRRVLTLMLPSEY